MLRLIKLLILFALIIAVAAGTYFWVARVPTLERALSRRLGTDVTLQGVDLGWSSVTLHGLKIANPESSEPALRAKSLRIDISPFKLFKDEVHIDFLSLDSPLIDIRLSNRSGSQNNWVQILANLPPSAPSKKRFVIDTLTINNIRFKVTTAEGKTLEVPPIPYIELKNIGKGNPLTLAQVGEILFQTILRMVARNPNLRDLIDQLPNLPQAVMGGVEAILPAQPTDTLQEGIEMLKEKGQDAAKALRNLFSAAWHRFSKEANSS